MPYVASMETTARLALGASLALLLACGGDAPPPDAAPPADGGSTPSDAAASDAGDGDASAGDASADDGGASLPGQLHLVACTVDATCGADIPYESCAAIVGVSVVDVDRELVGGATVTVNGEPTSETSPGIHRLTLAAVPTRLEVRASLDGRVIDVVLEAPSDYTWGVSPDPPVQASSATITWSPSGEADIETVLSVSTPGRPTLSLDGADPGTFEVPASYFSGPGPYTFTLRRIRQRATPRAELAMTVTRSFSRTVE